MFTPNRKEKSQLPAGINTTGMINQTAAAYEHLTPKRSLLAVSKSVNHQDRLRGNSLHRLDPTNILAKFQQQYQGSLLPDFGSSSNSMFGDVPLTRQLFLEAYSRGKWNLSVVPMPPCYNNSQMLKAPISYNENARLKSVDLYMNLAQWKNVAAFTKLMNSISRDLKCSGASISLVDERHQIVKIQKSFFFKECPRGLSIDAHTILSSDFFLLLDASKDWRTQNYPLIKGTPFMKFYVGVPLISKTGQAIGALAIFDVYPREDFSKKNIQLLKNAASTIMQMLNTPIAVDSLPIGSTIESRANLGRATSQRFITGSNVFEKDGSGSAYSQSVHFRISKSGLNLENKSILELWKSLVFCGDSKNASNFLCRKLYESLKFKLVYIMEIRIVEPYKIASDLLPMENKIDAENFPYMKNLERNGEHKIETRVLGLHGMSPECLKLEPLIHYRAFVSEFGITYKNYDNAIRFKSGICIPVLKRNTSIVRKKPVRLTSKITHGTPIDIFLSSGGVLIAGFNEDTRQIVDSEIDEIVQCASVLRQIYLMN